MYLNEQEQQILNGRLGPEIASVFASQIQIGEFFGAEKFVEVSNAHFMGDYEVMGDAGADLLTELVLAGLKVKIPTTRNAQCIDVINAKQLRQSLELIQGEKHITELLTQLGVSVTNTCIGYQNIYQPHIGEHVAWGDTGTVAYANSVLGARTNYEAGPSSLAAGLTGRTPEYGFHLKHNRRANIYCKITTPLVDLAEWGALGVILGQYYRDYWAVPVFDYVGPSPISDQLKQLGASLASYCSMAMFHLIGSTPEAPSLEAACSGRQLIGELEISRKDIEKVLEETTSKDGSVHLVVFSAPQLSLFELRNLAMLVGDQHFHQDVTVIITTNFMVAQEAERLGYLAVLEKAGAIISKGTCWYIMQPELMRKEFGWSEVVTNSSKLANIIRAHNYRPILRSTQQCIQAAITAKV